MFGNGDSVLRYELARYFPRTMQSAEQLNAIFVRMQSRNVTSNIPFAPNSWDVMVPVIHEDKLRSWLHTLYPQHAEAIDLAWLIHQLAERAPSGSIAFSQLIDTAAQSPMSMSDAEVALELLGKHGWQR
jgi:plasmid replication initiation protein